MDIRTGFEVVGSFRIKTHESKARAVRRKSRSMVIISSETVHRLLICVHDINPHGRLIGRKPLERERTVPQRLEQDGLQRRWIGGWAIVGGPSYHIIGARQVKNRQNRQAR